MTADAGRRGRTCLAVIDSGLCFVYDALPHATLMAEPAWCRGMQALTGRATVDTCKE